MTPTSIQMARKLITSQVTPALPESIPLDQAVFRIASQTLRALFPVPDSRLSSMDGFAVAAKTSAGKGTPATLKVLNEIAAGAAEVQPLAPGTAARIMTGAPLPRGADMVIPLESCREHGGSVTIQRDCDRNTNIRTPGSEIKKNQSIVMAGKKIMPEHLPALALAGHRIIPVAPRPEIIFLSTGSELVSVGEENTFGKITGGNCMLLDALVNRAGGVPVSLGICPDHEDEILATLAEKIPASTRIVITTGGTGPGKYDLMRQVFKKLGCLIIYDGLAVNPGGHTLLGRKGEKLFFALPGPPPVVSVLFELLVVPAIRKLQGINPPLQKTVPIKLAAEMVMNDKKTTRLKAGTFLIRKGELFIRPAGRHEAANGIMIIPAHRRILKPGKTVKVIASEDVGGNFR